MSEKLFAGVVPGFRGSWLIRLQNAHLRARRIMRSKFTAFFNVFDVR